MEQLKQDLMRLIELPEDLAEETVQICQDAIDERPDWNSDNVYREALDEVNDLWDETEGAPMTFGVEGFVVDNDDPENSPGLWYINLGDVHDLTLCYVGGPDRENGFYVTSYGDFLMNL